MWLREMPNTGDVRNFWEEDEADVALEDESGAGEGLNYKMQGLESPRRKLVTREITKK